ncbi:hypothetical protein WCE14_09045 [Acinetobacter schindleri]|uniref:Uncharacterized protein n=1 Tax=Acinetobacter schindleri NIPH 900 TaxID=1217675 RepID=N8Y5Y0_9GAMM|nr:hypothetical protein [Acinetobacter schindleri]ENV14735.1 hypothetical protein F965_00081 [Acinetobacter schindleri NIPH 900]
MTRPLTPKECVEQSIGRLILDFRRWLVPETKLLSRWRTQMTAYAVAEGRLVNDFNAMVDSYRKKQKELPMLIVAVQHIAAPPDLSQVIGTPFEVKTIIKTDPLKRRVTLRTEPRTYHVQFVFLANDPDSANSFTSQFCSYVRLMEKRRFPVNYYLSPDVREEWAITMFDNSLYPDSASLDETNLVAGLVEFDLSGLVPRVITGLPPLYEDEFTYENGGGPGEGPGGGAGSIKQFDVVVEADLFKARSGDVFTRINADPETQERTEQQLSE